MYAGLICLVLCGTYKILGAIVLLFCSNFFQSFEFDGNSIPFQLYRSKKDLRLDILSGWLGILSQFNEAIFGFIVAFLSFIQLGESMYSKLFYEDCNIINQHFQKQNCYPSFFLPNFSDNFPRKTWKVPQ